MQAGAGDPMGSNPIHEIARAAALVRRAGRTPVKVRVHPLDWELLRRRYGMKGAATVALNASVMGIPVELDCAVRRGHPEADYPESHH